MTESLFGNFMIFLGNAGRLPQLVPDQILKLKQLTVLTLSELNKVFVFELINLFIDLTMLVMLFGILVCLMSDLVILMFKDY